MQPRTADQIDAWPTQPLTGGYEGLHRLAGESFTGAVSTAGSWLFMLNGRCVGTEGRLEDFAEASGTVHTAPDAALPLLFSMFVAEGEERGQYYTGRTPLSTVHETLRDGGFTGYVELSENVISGDYYVAYYGGDPAFAAFVGQSDRLLTGEEAFDRACDEVGIYTVTATTLDVRDVPGRAAATQSTAPAAGASAAAAGTTADADQSVADSSDARSPDTGPSDGGPSGDAPDAEGADEPLPVERSNADAAGAVDGATDAGTAESPGRDSPRPADALGDREREATTDSPDAGRSETEVSDPTPGPEADWPEWPDAPGASDPAGEAEADDDTPAPPTHPEGLTPAVRDVRGTPAPDVPDVPDAPSLDGADGDGVSGPPDGSVPEAPTDGSTELDDIFRASDADEVDAEAAGATAAGGSTARAAELEAARDRATVLERRLADTEDEMRRVADERDAVTAERDELRERVARFEARIEELEAEGATAPEGTSEAALQHLTPAAALADTDLFVRYGSRGDATLSDAHAGADNRDAVRANLDLEHHTRFDGEAVAVDGSPFEAFLPTTLEHEFVDWFVRDLLFEVRETGHADALRALYDVVPDVDRAELHGSVDVEDGSVDFDVVCRDRLGNPLVCVDLHDSRNPATAEEMEALLTSANEVASVHDGFAGAFLVASSFFDPGALELADEVTASGGFLGGGKRASYVRVTRKRGYHLCLVEARERRFHVTVPEL
ncbi:DUF7527 domain-containing protein [Halomarina litorea]|uniref:DUF7527 domain-containing protein n=1 Tax=Halomarina litorea TaxID=2961595 RepID=UPI0020C2EEFB|nr:hypothetical protein [Halomarina sp. BCD28]